MSTIEKVVPSEVCDVRPVAGTYSRLDQHPDAVRQQGTERDVAFRRQHR